MGLLEKACVTKVNRVVRSTRCDDEKLRIENTRFAVLEIVCSYWIHVVNQKIAFELVAGHTQITAVIADYYFIARETPLSRCVELLVDPSIKPKGAFSHNTFEHEVVETIFESLKTTELSIRSNPLHLHRVLRV